jgi:hypothetical protein
MVSAVPSGFEDPMPRAGQAEWPFHQADTTWDEASSQEESLSPSLMKIARSLQ